jgi:hypothetical protein
VRVHRLIFTLGLRSIPHPKTDLISLQVDSYSQFLLIVSKPSVSDWVDKNPLLKWGAIGSIAALALLLAQAFNNQGRI